MTAATARPAREVAPLADRMGYLQILRVSLACVVLASGLLAPKVVGASIDDLALVTAGYLLLSAGAEGLRRMGRGPGLVVVASMLLVDGAFLAWVMYMTGSSQSPLRFLAYIHLIAVTLAASYRTGLKLALWYSLMFFVVYYAQVAEILSPVETLSESQFRRASVFNILAFWLVAIATTAFSSLNERELRRRQADLEALATMAGDLENVTEPEMIATALLDHMSDSFDFGRGVVLGGAETDLSLLAYRGPGEPAVDRVSVDGSVTEAYETRHAVLLRSLDTASDKGLATLLPLAHNVVVLPLFAEGEPLGVIAVEHTGKSRARIHRRVVIMAEQFAAHGALALRNAWLLEQIQKMADTDPLTRVANRRSFDRVLERELSRASRAGEQVTLAMFDIDHFKSINDEHGHQVGDEVLQQVAACLAGALRSFDTVARYGGEEFAVVLPSCSVKESLMVVERLRKTIANVEAPCTVTASAGVATFPAHAPDPVSLVKAADEALYESKRRGRDRLTRSRRRSAQKEPAPSASTA